MTYRRNKPDPGPSPKLDASIIRTNFSDFNTVFTVGHIALNQQNQGDHGVVVFEKQAFGPTDVVNSIALFNKDATSHAGTQPQLFIKIPKFLPTNNDTTVAQNTSMQLTYNTVNVAGPQYQSFLVGGYLIYFGSGSGTTNAKNPTSDTITLSPVPTKILVALASANTDQAASPGDPFTIATEIISTSQFKVRTGGNNKTTPNIPYSFTWTAIGTV